MQQAEAIQFSLRQMVEISGLSEFTLRGWESRHRALAPRRTSTGRRIYGSTDLAKALALRRLTEQGSKISEIARLSVEQLEKKLLANSASVPIQEANEKIPTLLLLVENHQWPELEESLEFYRATLATPLFLHEIALPLMQQLSLRVASGRISVGQELVVSAMMKEKLYLAASRANNCHLSSFRAVLTTSTGDLHEIGLLVAYALARHAGVAALYLGPNTPKKELCETALRFKANLVILSSMFSKSEGATEELYSYVNFLDQHLPAETAIWLSGRAAQSFEARLSRPVQLLSTFEDLRKALPSPPAPEKKRRVKS
jgi:DNA-binding transcriptional MerR regulator